MPSTCSQISSRGEQFARSATIMNKFTSIVIASLASVASARLTLTGDERKGGEAYDARIIISGLLQDMSKKDLKTIGESAVTAYNDMFSEVGFTIDRLETKASIPLDSMSWAPLGKAMMKSSAPPPPEDEIEIMYDDDDGAPPTDNATIAESEHYYNSGGCGSLLCNDDDSILYSNSAQHSELIFVGVDWYNQGGHSSAFLPNVAELYKAFEVSFCSKLRSSGLTNLVNAKDCSFSFVEKSGDSITTPIDVSAYHAALANNKNGAKKTEAHVTMKGLLHDFSNADRELINQSILSAHNQVFSGAAGYSLRSFNVVADVDVKAVLLLAGDDYKNSRRSDADCRFLCANSGEDSTMFNVVTLISAIAVVADESAVVGANVPARPAGQLHEAFEKSFCTKLQKSGAANFVNVHDCSFRFVNRPPRVSQIDMAYKTA